MNNDVLSDQTPPQNIEAEKAVLGAAFFEWGCVGGGHGIRATGGLLSPSTSNYLSKKWWT